MGISMKSATEVYKFTSLVIQQCREHGYDDIAQQLDDALHLGSSGLEILGAIKATMIEHAAKLEKVMDKAKLTAAIEFVNKAYGID